MAKLIIITGGARSGKSSYAQARAEAIPGPRTFVATCPKIDPEMDERIRRHQDERAGKEWQTIEEERGIAEVVKNAGSTNVFLIDCLTLWVNNLLYSKELQGVIMSEDHMRQECAQFIDAAKKYPGNIICVTNEVGNGIVPDNSAARLYRDLVGRCNQILAEAADEVVLVSCGLPLKLKSM